jgi:hypothetical protein
MAATAFDNALVFVAFRPDAIAHLVEPYIETVAIHTVSKPSSDDAIQEPNVAAFFQVRGILPIVLMSYNPRERLIDGVRQLLGGYSDVQIDDGGL